MVQPAAGVALSVGEGADEGTAEALLGAQISSLSMEHAVAGPQTPAPLAFTGPSLNHAPAWSVPCTPTNPQPNPNATPNRSPTPTLNPLD